ncbi:MAG: AzlD domain-containing protein [Symploca sp. SIO2B6]|nr:AzlD domain-containing protein [Symploca sp. SIO2B6]
MEQEKIFLIILGMMIVTYLPRLLPAWFLSKRTLPLAVEIWLRYVPISVIGAMLLPSLLLQEGSLQFNGSNLYLLGAVPTIAVSLITRSLFITVLMGILFVSVLRLIYG